MATLSKLKELMSIPGAVAAGIFSDDGKLIAYYGDINEKAAEIAAIVYGFAVAGGKYATCIMGNVGVFVELDKADFDKTFEVLSKYL